MKKRIQIIAATVLTAAFAISCTDDMEVNNGSDNGEIMFNVIKTADWMGSEDSIKTRSIQMGTSDGSELLLLATTKIRHANANTRGTATTAIPDQFTINAYTYTGGPTPTWTTYFDGEVAQPNNGTGKWGIANAQYWPNASDFLRFYGYVETGGSGSSVSYVAGSGTNSPKLDFTVQSNVSNQTDLMTSSTEALRYKSGIKVEMPFHHALTCVKFTVGGGLTGCTIKEVSLKRIVTHATYDFDNGWANGTAVADTTDFELAGINFTSTEGGSQIVYDEADGGASALTFLMIPQSFNKQSQMVEVVFNNGYSDITAQATLQGTTWLPGTIVTYNLAVTGDYEYTLNVTPVTIDHEGGVTSFNVTSYRQAGDNAPEPLAWRVIGYSADGINFFTEKPASCGWVGFTDLGSDGSVAITTHQVYVKEQSLATSSLTSATDDATVMAAYLSTRTAKGTENAPYDLSIHDFNGNTTLQNTANCYVVNAPGWYKLPLVYGNAIKNGASNEDAYTAGTAVDNNYMNYPNYDGGFIETPYVYDAATPNKAILIWEDAQNLITTDENYEIGLCDYVGNKPTYLKFNITPTNIKQGNAIVAITDGTGAIMWSWHIWVTAIPIGTTIPITNHDGNVFNIMPVTLGWCSVDNNGIIIYNGTRKVYAKIQQDGGKTAVLEITQDGGAIFKSELGYAPYYQWGRKDPLQPTMGGTNASDRQTYGKYPANHNTSSSVNYQTSIRTPNQMFSVSNGNWCDTYRKDLWCARNTTEGQNNSVKIIKTIYDPCPVGFHVPETKTFTGFTTTGNKVNNNNSALTGTYITAARNGFEIYTNSTMTETVHFPVLGERVTQPTWYNGPSPATGIVPSYCVEVLYTSSWTAIPASSSQYLYLLLDLWSGYGRFWPTYNDGGNTSSHGHPIRPVADY